MNNNLASLGKNYGEESTMFANFNQSTSSLVVGTQNGLKIFDVSSVNQPQLLHDNQGQIKDISLVDRSFSSSLVAFVSMSNPRKLTVMHFKKNIKICDLHYSDTIVAVKLNQGHLIVLREKNIHIYEIRVTVKLVHTICDVPANPGGLCYLSTDIERSFLAYPNSTVSGKVHIFDASSFRAVITIDAHISPLAAITFNESAKKLATASVKGTVIRVFSIPDCQKLFEFRRGVKRCVSIGSLCFSSDSMFLSASSNTETVHIFKLEQAFAAHQETRSWINYLRSFWRSSAEYMPSQVTEYLNQDRDFATVRLPFSEMRNTCSIACFRKLLRVLVVGENGYLYIYNLDPLEGGECTLLRQYSLLNADQYTECV